MLVVRHRVLLMTATHGFLAETLQAIPAASRVKWALRLAHARDTHVWTETVLRNRIRTAPVHVNFFLMAIGVAAAKCAMDILVFHAVQMDSPAATMAVVPAG